MSYVHTPILVDEIIRHLVNVEDKLFIDCTLGEGGHSEVILTKFSNIVVYGLDRDKEILEIARKRLSVFGERFNGLNINFRDVSLENIKKGGVFFDSALIDLGISMYHYKKSERGFSFSKNEKLDMTLDGESESVFEIINYYDEEALSAIFFDFGEERFSRRVAKKIVESRRIKPIEYSDQLADIIFGAIPRKFHNRRIHPATQCFQALRIYANNELENIKIGIPKVLSILKNNGRLGVMTFHSIEDRLVKNIFNELNKDCLCPKELPVCLCGGNNRKINWIAKSIKPSSEEISINPASRSAKLRIVEKI